VTVETFADQELILARVDSVMAQTVYNDVADGVVMEWVTPPGGGTPNLKAYIAVDFGEPVAKATGRSISVEEKQPTVQRVIMASVAGNAKVARQISSRLVGQMTGFVPSDNCGPLSLIGGGGYTMQVDNKPTVYVRESYWQYDGNMSD
jgi:hypothetical protein